MGDPRLVVVSFGDYKGRTLGEVYAVDPGYVRWVAHQDEAVPEHVRDAARDILGSDPGPAPHPAAGPRPALVVRPGPPPILTGRYAGMAPAPEQQGFRAAWWMAVLVGLGVFVYTRSISRPAAPVPATATPTAAVATVAASTFPPALVRTTATPVPAAPAPPLTPTPRPTRSAAPLSAPPTPTPVAAFVVAQTDGDGVYLRRTPRLADRLRAWPEGTRMERLGEQSSGDGLDWEKVRAPDGAVGWVPLRYLAPEAPPRVALRGLPRLPSPPALRVVDGDTGQAAV